MFPQAVSIAPPPLKLGFITPHNPYDRMAFSGTAWFAARALERHPGIEMRVLGPHVPPRRFDRLLRRRPAPVDADGLDLEGLEAVLGLVASPLLDRLGQTHPHLPLFHATDATPAFLREAYGWALPAEAETTETRVAANAAATIYSSGAMARRAAADLDLPKLQPAVVPFGVNLEDLPEHCPQKPPLNVLKLLFVGLDWARKGGDIAVAALNRLNASGHPAELTIVGRCPEQHRENPAIVHLGFLNKSNPKNRARLSALYREAHLLLLPSRADCTPMVVPEAMAHGTPVLTAETGGIAEQIGGAGAGRIMPQMAPPEDWARAILEMTGDPTGYAMMSDAAFERCQALFCWDQWAGGIEALVRQTLTESQVRPRRIA